VHVLKHGLVVIPQRERIPTCHQVRVVHPRMPDVMCNR
jgi:hypothetical protein